MPRSSHQHSASMEMNNPYPRPPPPIISLPPQPPPPPPQPQHPSDYLGPSRPSSSWTPEDDSRLMTARQQGMNWQVVASRIFPNKTPNACRKRHERLMERSNAEDWDGVKLELLAREYMEVRQQMWSILAERLNEKWTIIESKCFEKGLKNLTAAARSANRRSIGTDDSGIAMDGDIERGLNMSRQYDAAEAYAPPTNDNFGTRAANNYARAKGSRMSSHRHGGPPPPPPAYAYQHHHHSGLHDHHLVPRPGYVHQSMERPLYSPQLPSLLPPPMPHA